MQIAVIDDGIRDDALWARSIRKMIADDDGHVLPDTESTDQITHGTVCAGIIRKYLPKCPLVSIRVLDSVSKKGNIKKLISALRWCQEHHIKICNLSLGSIDPGDGVLLKEVIVEMVRAGHILIAAMANNEQSVLPADFIGVIRVKADNTLKDGETRVCSGWAFQPDIAASSVQTVQISETVTCAVKEGNSYAVPVVTARIAKAVEENPNDSVLQILMKLRMSDFPIDVSLIGKNRDLECQWAEREAYIKFLYTVAKRNFEVPVIYVYGKNCLAAEKNLRTELLLREYAGLRCCIVSDTEDRDMICLPNAELFLSAGGWLSEYFRVDYVLVVCADKLHQLMKTADDCIDTAIDKTGSDFIKNA